MSHPLQQPYPSIDSEQFSCESPLLASIIDTAMDAILVLDEQLTVRLFNDAAEELFGWRADEVIGGSLERFLPRGIGSWHDQRVREFGKANLKRHHMGRQRQTVGVRRNGDEFPIETSLSVFTMAGVRYYTAIIRDITERARTEAELRYLSSHDVLTGLYNRRFFEDELARMERSRLQPISLMIADVDGLKQVNDTQGHQAGDELICLVAGCLRSAFRAEDVVARLGGDEFGILLPLADSTVTTAVLERVYTSLAQLRELHPHLNLSVSIGTATALPGEKLSHTLVRADEEMYLQKRANRRAR